jgi:hypothetical protein
VWFTSTSLQLVIKTESIENRGEAVGIIKIFFKIKNVMVL